MHKAKKFTQTTLPFVIKSKSADVPVKVSPATSQKRPRSVDSKDEHQKRLKGAPDVKKKTASACVEISDSEPQVSSSSEQVLSPVTASQSNTLDPFIKLIRCETPKIEVTSSTSTDELNETNDDIVVLDVSSDVNQKTPEKTRNADRNKPLTLAEQTTPSSGENVTDAQTSSQNTPSELMSPIPSGQLPPPTSGKPQSSSKRLTVSAQKRRNELKAAAELRQKQREEEKEQKRLQKLEKEKELEERKRAKAEQKEAERLAKLQEKAEKQRLKEAAQALKQAEIDSKKEADKQRKEEEKQRKELERLQIEEEKTRKKNAQKDALLKYLQKPVKKDSPEKPDASDARSVGQTMFKPFSIKADMRLAPLCRAPPIDKANFDEAFSSQLQQTHVYLTELKSNGGRTNPSTWPWLEDDDIVAVVPGKRYSVKLLQFHTDIRPAYFGTWRKKSSVIRARRPFGEDKERFDYEVDSADEWEEEEPGESVDSGDEEEEEKDEFDFDPELREDGFLVDHNYLSDGEGGASDDEESLAAKKTKQMIARTYGKRNRKKNRLKPVVYGTVWQGEDNSETESHHSKMLHQFAAIVFQSIPIEFVAPVKEGSPLVPAASSVSASKKKLRTVPEEAMPSFIRMVHGCRKGADATVQRFQEFWHKETSNVISKKQLKLTIQSMASYQKKDGYKRICWYVSEEKLMQYGLQDLPVPNPIHQTEPRLTAPTPPTTTPPVSKSSSASNIAQKRLTDFVQPVRKKLKVDDNETEQASVPQPRKVDLITLTDSPTNQAVDKSSANALVTGTEIVASPRRVSLTTVGAASKDATPSSRSSQPQSVPRRVGLITIQSNQPARSPTTNVASPRRVTLTTLTTPPKIERGNSETVVNSPKPIYGTPKATDNFSSQAQVCTPKSTISGSPKADGGTPRSTSLVSPQTKKSPRRVQFTTLSQSAAVPAAASKVTHALMEQSQNTPKHTHEIALKRAPM